MSQFDPVFQRVTEECSRMDRKANSVWCAAADGTGSLKLEDIRALLTRILDLEDALEDGANALALDWHRGGRDEREIALGLLKARSKASGPPRSTGLRI
jgi:hypothetical protein